MEFRVLGPITVWADDAELEITAAKPRRLLARLLVARGQPVPAERLVEDLWEHDVPRSAAQTLQTYVSQLRKVLGPDRVVTLTGGYGVVVGDDELDSAAFEAEVAAGRRSLVGGDAASAAALFDTALARWRGPALLDVASAHWAQAEAARLEELRADAMEASLEARFTLGELAEVVARGEAAVAEHPFRERLWALLITALYSQDRQADALRAYQRLRDRLVDELGIEPSRELRDLEARLLRQEPLAMSGSTTPPPALERARGAVLPTGVVTFLLTDIVGSTRLWEDGPDIMADEVARHEALFRTVVDAQDGVLLKARGEGDSTFSVFQRATNAVAAAVGMLEHLGEAAFPFTVRLAVHTGEAVEREGDYFGRTVNRAARLRAAAPPSQVLLSQATADLVVDDLPPGYRLHAMGVQELRDLTRPEAVFVVTPVGDAALPKDDRREGRRVPLPTRAGAGPAGGLVGRTTERALLTSSFEAATAGHGSVVLIGGEPGIGKTSLASDFATTAFDAGATVLFGRCDEGLGLPYQPWVEMVSHLVTHLDDGVIDKVGDRRLGDLARLVPAVLDRRPRIAAPTPGDGDTDRWALFNAVHALVVTVAADTPLVLVLDDLQWADRPTLALLRHVVNGTMETGVLVVGTYREGELGADHQLTEAIAALGRDAAVERLVLRGLGDDELVSLVESLTGQTLAADSRDFVHSVRRETDGNPFFTAELLRHLAESGALYLDDSGRWVPRADLDTAGLPDTVRDVIRSRVRKLGRDVEALLRLAAVIGREFDLDTLAAAGSVDTAVAVDHLEKAEAAGLVVGIAAARFAFAHALVAHALQADLTPTRRAIEHRRVAEAIEEVSGGDRTSRAAELARHWAEASSFAGDGKVVGYARTAGDVAMRALAPDEAARWYAQALEHLGPGEEEVRCDLLVRFGRAQRDAGDNADRSTLLDAGRLAVRLDADALLVRAALANSRGFVGSVDPLIAERIGLVATALERCPPGDAASRARLLATLAVETRGMDPSADCGAYADEAVALAREVQDPRLLAHVLNMAFFAIWLPGTLDLRLALTAEACALAGETGDLALVHWSATWRAHSLIEAARVDEAVHWLDVMDQVAQDGGPPSVQWLGPSMRAGLCALQGDVGSARKLADTSHRRAVEVTERDALAVRLAILAMCAWHEGSDDPEIARLGSHPAFEDATWRETVGNRSYWTAERALVGDTAHGDIRAWLDQWRDGHDGRGVGAVGYACVLAERCPDLGTAEHAERLLHWLAPYRGQVASMGSHWMGATAHYAGVLAAHLGRVEEADAYFAEADATNERIGAPFFLARTRLARARLALQGRPPGDSTVPRDLASSALALARANGCSRVAQEAERLLAR